MADVYYGMDVKLHRQVAIKVFDVDTRTRATQVDRFMQEARMMANWRHENIMQIYYAGDEKGLFYYVMEYIDGYDLASIMSVYDEKGELMSIDDVLRIGDSIANALDYAHSQNVIHRDVKPANVLVANSDGRVVLGDFGLALDLTEKSQGEVFGSPHYIAPEQARRSSDAVPQSDLYSLGVILYEMFTGVTPFDDPSAASLALQHITDAPPLPRSINPSISVQVEKVLLKALEKSPKDRYQSGKSLMNALRKALKAAPEKVAPDAQAALPPIPVNAPTIQRSSLSLNSFTQRSDVKSALEERTTTRHQAVDEDLLNPPKDKKNRWGWLLVLLLLLLLLSWGVMQFRPDIIEQWQANAAPTSINTAQQLAATDTASPTLTSTVVAITATQTKPATQTATASATPTAEHTQTTSPSATVTFTPTQLTMLPTVVTSTSTPTTIGYPMVAYYNENSFYIFNKGDGSRSASGFVFERIDKDGVIQQRFEGWQWEKYFATLQSQRCMSLEIYLSPDPYLSPAECDKRTLSRLSLTMKSPELFWTPRNADDQFRILWLNEEIARCEIEAGVCEFYVP